MLSAFAILDAINYTVCFSDENGNVLMLLASHLYEKGMKIILFENGVFENRVLEVLQSGALLKTVWSPCKQVKTPLFESEGSGTFALLADPLSTPRERARGLGFHQYFSIPKF